MSCLLYIETNFLMAVATGRDPDSEKLLEKIPTGLKVAIPAVCCMESLSAFEDEKKRLNKFKGTLDNQIAQLKRDLSSSNAKTLFVQLQQAIQSTENLLNDTQFRLFDALNSVAYSVEIIHFEPLLLARNSDSLSINNSIIEDPTDALILHIIIAHAIQNKSGAKAFVSGNTKDFGSQEIRDFLRANGSIRYFAKVSNFLGWYSAGCPGGE